MNIMGKILVFLNLVAAVAVAAFIAVTYTTNTNWKKYTDGLKGELNTANSYAGRYLKTSEDLEAQVKKLRGEFETVKANAKADSDKLLAQLKVANSQRDDAIQKAREVGDLVGRQLVDEVKRLKQEALDLGKVIEARQNKILELEKITQELRTFARAKEKEALDDHARNETLKTEVLDLRKEIAKLQAGEKGRRPGAPPVNVRGVIEKVDDGLVQISLGSDSGLKKNHVLQIRRMKPRPEYLGSIQLVDVDFHKSIGRWMAPRPEGKSLRPGDQVVSSLDR